MTDRFLGNRKENMAHTQEEIDAIHQSNFDTIEQLAQRGLAIQFPPKAAIQFEVAVEMLFPTGSQSRLDFEYNCARKLQELVEGVSSDEAIEEARAERARQVLTSGVTGVGGEAMFNGRGPR